LGATAAAVQSDNALVELVAWRGGACSGGQAHAAGARANVASRNINVASRKTNVVNRNINVVSRTTNVDGNRAANVNVRPCGYGQCSPRRICATGKRLGATWRRDRSTRGYWPPHCPRLQRRGPALLLRQDIVGTTPIRVEPKTSGRRADDPNSAPDVCNVARRHHSGLIFRDMRRPILSQPFNICRSDLQTCDPCQRERKFQNLSRPVANFTQRQ
jgi:hypothetical protein